MKVTATCAIFTANEMVNIDADEVKQVSEILKNWYKEKKFGFIANRINSYSVNPIEVRKFFNNDNLVAGVIVSENKFVELASRYERGFIKTAQTEHFTDIDNAINWVTGIVCGKAK